MEQHIPIWGICFKQIQAARVMEQLNYLRLLKRAKIQAARVMEQG